MQLGGMARYLTHINSEAELLEAVAWAEDKKLRLKVIGSGSNIVWSDDGFDGLVAVMAIKDFEFIGDGRVLVGAGHDWDDVVRRTVESGLSGIEDLSYIPGTAGATPVQNVGAYGQEISKVLVSLRAYDRNTKNFMEIENADCAFGFRTSRFKTTDKNRFIIVSITLQLSHKSPTPPFYESLQSYLDVHSIQKFTPQTIRDAVIAIRTDKLPDPHDYANDGSFFVNPIVESAQFKGLKIKFPDVKSWQLPDDRIKISAGWLIEQAGFHDYHDKETGIATWSKQALVLINENAKSTKDLLTFKQKIVDAIQSKFGITLEQEPELIV